MSSHLCVGSIQEGQPDSFGSIKKHQLWFSKQCLLPDNMMRTHQSQLIPIFKKKKTVTVRGKQQQTNNKQKKSITHKKLKT